MTTEKKKKKKEITQQSIYLKSVGKTLRYIKAHIYIYLYIINIGIFVHISMYVTMFIYLIHIIHIVHIIRILPYTPNNKHKIAVKRFHGPPASFERV
jgi:nitrate/nitrite transporter NarK